VLVEYPWSSCSIENIELYKLIVHRISRYNFHSNLHQTCECGTKCVQKGLSYNIYAGRQNYMETATGFVMSILTGGSYAYLKIAYLLKPKEWSD
jgi:hypothetical protein